MNYLQSVLTLDAEALASINLGQEFDFRATPEGRSPLFGQPVRQEVECAATFTAVSASIANALALPIGSRINPSALETFAPFDMPALAAALARNYGGQGAGDLSAQAQAFEARLNVARRLSITHARERVVRVNRKIIELSALGNAWQHACTAAMRLLQELGQATVPSPQDGSSGEWSRILMLLTAAADGGHPCVEDDGCINIPGWAERRRHKRRPVELQARMHFSGTVSEITICDQSPGGLGLCNINAAISQQLDTGSIIGVSLAGRGPMSGRIAWIAGSKAGVILDKPLPSGVQPLPI